MNKVETKQFIDQIDKEQQQLGGQSGDSAWYDSLSENTKTKIKQLGWPPEIVAGGKARLTDYVEMLGDI
ncbi:MAG: hypothetical protein WC453_02675 [Patescibacteria group bacterium]